MKFLQLKSLIKYLILFFFIYILLFYSSKIFANQNDSVFIDNLKKFEYCNLEINQIKKIDVNIIKKDKWNKNLIKAYLSKTNVGQVINEKFKNRYKSDIIFHGKDNIKCKLKAKLRINGDWKDHIDLSQPNNYKVSLDVKVTHGNINGIRNFKLFIPVTKKSDNQIIYLNILKHLGFISPRSFKTPVSINGQEINYYNFVEKPSKELIEFHNLNEGPMLIVDERSIWDEVWKNQRNNNQLYLFKLKNRNWADKNLVTQKISFDALNILNSVYLNFHAYQLEYDPYIAGKLYTLNYNLDEKLNYDFSEVFKFDLISTAFDARYALIPNNRKFYFNSINNKFLPIGWDTMPNFDLKNYNYSTYLSPKYYNDVVSLINKIDIDELLKDINFSNVNLEKKQLSKIIENSLINLKQNLFDTSDEKVETIKKFYFPNKIKDFSGYFSNKNIWVPEHYNNKFIYSEFKNDKFLIYKCENNIYENCKIFKIKDKNIFNYIFDNNLIYINNREVYYKNNYDKLKRNRLLSKYFTTGKIYTTNDVKIDHDNNKKTLNIYAPKNSYIILNKVKISDYKINLYSIDQIEKNNFFVNAKGCLNIYDSHISNLEINVFNSHCEDALNIVNSTGDIKNINIINSFSDGVDFDFSKIKVKNLTVTNAKNDCVDFSYGEYFVEKLTVNNCQDKGISIGEKSIFNSIIVETNDTNISLASKDGSKTNIKNLNITKTNLCLAAYVKKKEFYGSSINIQNTNCETNDFIDNYSRINYE
jgi:hypothetical protein